MATATYNKSIDYFGLMAAVNTSGQTDKLQCKSSAENRSIQTATGANTYGDAAVVDAYGETAAPSAEYDVIGEIDHTAAAPIVTLGTVHTATGVAQPVVLGSLSISTQNGSAPSMSVSGQMVQTGATQLRSYKLPEFHLKPRHRAQDFLGSNGLVSIKKGANAASPIEDYGLESVNAQFPIEFTLAQPQGELRNYDIHGGTATVDYTMNWYSGTAPTIELTEAATALGAKMASLASRSDPDNGYTQYTWQVSFPLVGEEYVPPSNS